VTSTRFDQGPAWTVRIYALPCAWLAVLWSVTIVFGGVNIVWVVPLAAFVAVGVRILRVRATADDDALRIRNPFRNYRFDWTSVVDIEIEEVRGLFSSLGRASRLRCELTDGRWVPIVATQRVPYWGSGCGRKLDTTLDRLWRLRNADLGPET
jgi:hypothetical protein